MVDVDGVGRVLAVDVLDIAVGDGSYPPPAVGDVVTYQLAFTETPRGTTFRVEVTGGGQAPTAGLRWDGTPHDRPPSWFLSVRGDGWTATWSSTRAVTGVHDLTGVLRADPWSGGDDVRGRLLAVDGFRVELGLDDVPPPEPTPSITPGSVVGDATELWVGDSELPFVITVRGTEVVEHTWPEAIGSYVGRTLLPDGVGGCWVTGGEGARHLDGAGGEHLVDTTPVGRAVVVGPVLVTVVCNDGGIRLIRRDAEATEVDLEGARVLDLHPDGPSVVLDLVGSDGTRRPVQLDPATGHLTPRRAPDVTRHHYQPVMTVPRGMDIAALLDAARGDTPRPSIDTETSPADDQSPPEVDDATRAGVIAAVRDMVAREQARVDDPVTGAPGGDPTDDFGWRSAAGGPGVPVFDAEGWRWFRLLDVAWLHGDIWVRFAWNEPGAPPLQYLTSVPVWRWWDGTPRVAALLVRGELRGLLSPRDALRSAPTNANPGWRNRISRTWIRPDLVLVHHLALDQNSHDELWDHPGDSPGSRGAPAE